MESYELLERRWSDFAGMDHYVACSSGTAALHLAFETLSTALGWDKLDEAKVVVPDYTMIACARAVSMANLTPVFVDVDEKGGLPNRELWTTSHTKAVEVVHLYGRRSNIPRGLFHIVEDLAEAHGIIPSTNTTAACWSFYKNKVIAGEEGGMVAFREKELAEIARSKRCLGMQGMTYLCEPRGFNYRMSNCNADLILDSLSHYKENLAKRRDVEAMYEYSLHDVIETLPSREVPWVYDIKLPIGTDMVSVVRNMREKGIAARCGFVPMTQQPEYKKPPAEDGTVVCHRNSEELSKRMMYLPIPPTMDRNQVQSITDCFKSTLAEYQVGS